MSSFAFKKSKPFIKSGFTIVELLVVIVVIGILAAIIIVSYSSITTKVVAENIKSDLGGASTQLMSYYADNGVYPANQAAIENCPNTDTTKICAKSSTGTVYSYVSDGQTYTLIATNKGQSYYVTHTSSTPIALISDPDWITGIAATAMAGKYVRIADLGSTMSYKTTNTLVAPPQGAIGLDPNYPSNMSLVSPQTNPGVDFSAYSAQNACKAVSGRLPNMQELLAIYAGRSSYGNNFQTIYWSSTESSSLYAHGVSFLDGFIFSNQKPNSGYVRCVKG